MTCFGKLSQKLPKVELNDPQKSGNGDSYNILYYAVSNLLPGHQSDQQVHLCIDRLRKFRQERVLIRSQLDEVLPTNMRFLLQMQKSKPMFNSLHEYVTEVHWS